MSENNTLGSQDSHPSVARPLFNITSAIISALPAVDPRLSRSAGDRQRGQ